MTDDWSPNFTREISKDTRGIFLTDISLHHKTIVLSGLFNVNVFMQDFQRIF